jgi:hypothetical protein
MVLNPALFDALTDHFGSVRVSDENTPLKWEWREDPKLKKRVPKVVTGGEQYYVCCPVCRDTRFRLAIGHRFLTPLDKNFAPEPLKHCYKCYNENCSLFENHGEHRCVTAIRAYLDRHRAMVGLAVHRVKSRAPSTAPVGGHAPMVLPPGFVTLDQLPAGHPALTFVIEKYRFDPYYIAKAYGVGFVGVSTGFMQISNRIIFPIYENGALVLWQGRTILPKEQEPTRWYIPTGGKKVVYNIDRIPEGDVVVICEGIPAAIAAGPTATAVFGKDIDYHRAYEVVKKFRTAVIATDPETQIPDPRTRRKKGVGYDPNDNGRIFANEMRDKLVEVGMKVPPLILPYPAEVMVRAKAVFDYKRAVMDGVTPKNPGFDDSIPDPADIGMRGMHEILKNLPTTYRSAYLCR